MKYTFPTGFDLARAQELGALVDAAYAQYAATGPWQPAGYTILAELSAKELYKLPSPISTLAAGLLPQVPFGFVAAKGTDLYIVIRGTMTPLEWLDDFTAQPVPFQPAGKAWGNTTHGFNALYGYLGPAIIAALSTYQTGGGSLASIYVTGHSLGAALAHLAAAGVAAQFNVGPISYTFSGPRAGDPGFAAAFAAAGLVTWRAFNTEDIVPTLPPAAVKMRSPMAGMHGMTPMTQSLATFILLSPVGYQHVGYPIGVTFHRDFIADNHSLDTLCTELAM